MSMRICTRPFARGVRSLGARYYWTNSTDLPPPRLDYRTITRDAEAKAHNARIRKAPLPADALQNIVSLNSERHELDAKFNETGHLRNQASDRIKKCGKDAAARNAAIEEAKALKAQLAEVSSRMDDVHSRLLSLALRLPNDTHPDVPIGPESAARTISEHGPPPVEASSQRDHVLVGTSLRLLDLENASRTTGSSWYYLLNEGALLEMALTNYAMSLAARRGFMPVTTPDVVRSDVAYRCGFQPRDPDGSSQMYYVAPEHASDGSRQPELVLAGTAEIPIAGMFAGQDFEARDLPRKVVGLGHAFRAEAGARGADTRGLYRVHQFTKLELFAVTTEEQSEAMMEEFRSLQTDIFEGLGLTFRVLDMPTEELGASAYRKYDMEAWMPGRGKWGEISSTSNCTDYQARRLHIRYKKHSHGVDPQSGKPVENTSLAFAHTLNGTAVAVPRLIVSLLENGAVLDDEGVAVALNLPKALQPFWLHGADRGIIRWV